MDSLAEAKAETEVKKPFGVTVLYNGVPKEIHVRHEETVKQVLDRAVAAFAPLPQPHLMGLFNQAGEELSDSLTVDQAGIHLGDQLLLRPSKVKGG